MAVCCPDYGLLFIGNMRTASTAIEKALLEQCGGYHLPAERMTIDGELVRRRHATLPQLIRHGLLDRPREGLHAFVVVRNPFDSLVSKWSKDRHRPNRQHTRTAMLQMDFDPWIREWTGKRTADSLHDQFVEGTDEVLRFEELPEALHSVLRNAGAPEIDFPVVNDTEERQREYRAYYTAETRAMVESVYGGDLERYGYAF